MKRVVLTGAGVVSPIGNSLNELWSNLLDGKHGFSEIDWVKEDDLKPKIAARVRDFDPSRHIDRKEMRRLDRFTQFAVSATHDAIEDAGTDFSDLDPFRVGVIVGSGKGGIETMERELERYHSKGADRVSVFCVPMMISNMAAGTIAMRLGFKGSNYCPVTACSSGTHAIGEAFRLIKHGYLDAAVAGGSESSSTGFSFAGFNNMKALSKSEDPDRASIPFDAERSGFVMGEGSGIVILEELEHALARGAKIYAEITGYGSTCDAYHITSPDPDGIGAAKAMEMATIEGGLLPTDIDYINAHGTSTPLNDKFETIAIKRYFGEHAYKLAVNSSKSMTGHLLGAAGGIEAVITMLSIKNQRVHRTLGYEVADPECDLDYVVEGSRDMQIRAAISNSLGFGGHNASLCFKKYE